MEANVKRRSNIPIRIISVIIFFILVVGLVWKNKDNAVGLWFFGQLPPVPVVLIVPVSMLAGAILIYPFMALRTMRARKTLREYERIYGPLARRPQDPPDSGET